MRSCSVTTAGVALAVVALIGSVGCTAHASTGASDAMSNPGSDAWRGEMLDLAMDAASAMPIVPHIKSRSAAQYKVFRAAVDLEDADRAETYLKRIDDWRRGLAAADYALLCARLGRTESIEKYSRLARAGMLLAKQDWQTERIELTLVRMKLVLGDTESAREFRRTIREDVHRGRIEMTESKSDDAGEEQEYFRIVGQLDSMLKSQRYEVILNCGVAYANLYQRHYGNADRRDVIEDKLRQAYRHMPGPEMIDLLLRLAEAALANEDAAKAVAFADEAGRTLANAHWSKHDEYEYQYRAKIARLRFKAGDREGAIEDLETAEKRYQVNEEHLVDIWRADALRPIAEAYAVGKMTDKALTLYARTVELGLVNPNSRPRVDDLVATCISMALHDVEPSADLWSKIQAGRAQLGAPW